MIRAAMSRRGFLASIGGGLGIVGRRTEVAPVFDGRAGHVEIPDCPEFSQPAHGALTVEAWLRPDSLAMPRVEGSGYVHWIGKGEPRQQEWVARMYQQGNREGRANRMSFYAFNLMGGLGAGSYFQDRIDHEGLWFHVAGRVDAANTSIFRDGRQHEMIPFGSRLDP